MVIRFSGISTICFPLLILCFILKGTNSYGQWVLTTEAMPSGIYQQGAESGTVFGSVGSYDGVSTREKVFDGFTNTFFDAPTANGQWAAKDFGVIRTISRIRFTPRSGNEPRMTGGKIQVSVDAAFTNPVTLYTIPTGVVTTFADYDIKTPSTDPMQVRYIRYLSPDDGWGNIAEMKFYGPYDATTPATPSIPNYNPHHPSHGTTSSLTGDLYTNAYTITRNGGSSGGIGIFLTDTSVWVSELVTGTHPDGTWPDFVFDKDYKLTGLSDLETYINTNKHLPGVASREAVEKSPYYRVDDMVQTLLTKIEELTLYLIDQEKDKKKLLAKSREQQLLMEDVKHMVQQCSDTTVIK
jgi:hypothetical protein